MSRRGRFDGCPSVTSRTWFPDPELFRRVSFVGGTWAGRSRERCIYGIGRASDGVQGIPINLFGRGFFPRNGRQMRIPRSVFLWVVLVGLILPKVATSQYDLWHKAVEIAARNQDWVPGRACTRTEVLNKKGKVEHVEESELRIVPDENGRVKTEIVRVVKDGKDETAEARKKQREAEKRASDRGGKHPFRTGKSPFLPEMQDSVVVQPLDSVVVIDSVRCAGFRFEERVAPDRRIVGTAWLDVKSGAPIVLEFEPRPLPKHVKDMRTRIRYRRTPDGGWYPVEMVTTGEGGFLFVKKRFRNKVELSKHWRVKEEADKGNSN